MKKLLVSALVLLSAGVGRAQPAPASVLSRIQRRLTYTTPHDSLLYLVSAMDQLRSATPNAYASYWEAYAEYRLTYTFGKDRASAEKAAEKGVQLLEGIKNKTAEHYALLSLLEGVQLQFASTITLPFKAATVMSLARKAIDLAPGNPRGYLALALNDYYTPKLYGGGALVEENLKKALSLPAKVDANSYAPDWGHPAAYLYLANYYRREGQTALAKQYAREGAAKYPDHAGLQKLSAKL